MSPGLTGMTLLGSTMRWSSAVLPLDRPGLYSIAARELVSNIVDGASCHRCDVEFGNEIVRILGAIDQSLSTGKRIALAT